MTTELTSKSQAKKSKLAQKVLIVDDDPMICCLLKKFIGSSGYSVNNVHNLRDMKSTLSSSHYDVVLLDVRLGIENGLDAIPWVLTNNPRTRIIAVTSDERIEIAVEAMKLGACSFFCKSMNLAGITDEIDAVLASGSTSETISIAELNMYTKRHGLYGAPKYLSRLFYMINKLASVNSTVLVTGESGTGKEVVSKAIHNASDRSSKIFTAINCGAIPENLLESELFGYKKGAFTDAKTNKVGVFEIASEGTLLLDEIADMPLRLQVKLLRVLQEREITPIGSTRSVKVDTRIIAATNKDLREEVRQKRFREDLYYRLSVLNIETKPLRKSPDCIPRLVSHFLEMFNHVFKRDIEKPAHDVMTRLQAYSWPGNVREIRNAIERAVVMSQDNQLHIEDVFPQTDSEHKQEKSYTDYIDVSKTLSEMRNSMESEYLEKVLKMTRGNITKAARISGIHRANVYRLIARHDIQTDRFQ